MRNNSFFISVVIPAYNEERNLPKCLSSLRNQTFPHFEIIVVDNNSWDKTAEIARLFGARVVYETIQGMTPARERGFREAKGPIIARTDADTILTPNWLYQIYREFQKDPSLSAVTGSAYFPELGSKSNKLLKFQAENYFRLTKAILGHYPLFGPNYALRKEAWETVDVHRDDRLVHEDIDLACHLVKTGKIKFNPKIKVGFSLRRWKKKFWYTLFEYTLRYVKTVAIHHPKYTDYQNLLTNIRKSAQIPFS